MFQQRRPEHSHSHSHGRRHSHSHAQRAPQVDDQVPMVLFQILLLIAFAILVMYSYSAVSVPTSTYSFTKTRHFPVQRTTNAGVVYYTAKEWNIRKVSLTEEDINQQYLKYLKNQCDLEIEEFKKTVTKMSDKRKKEAEERLKTGHCAGLNTFEQAINHHTPTAA